jgi:hypothetical protein
MNRKAEQHLAKAEEYVGKGEKWYAKAADEIIAAKAADFSLTNAEIGKRFGRSEPWVRKLVAWRTNPSSSTPTPYAGEAPAVDLRKAKQWLREAPAEQIEQALAELPSERVHIVGAAVGDAYSVSRREFDEAERDLSPAQRKAREAGQDQIQGSVAKAMSGFDTFGIVNHLGQATSILTRMIAEDTLTEEYVRQVDTALAAFLDEYRVAQAKVAEEEVV